MVVYLEIVYMKNMTVFTYRCRARSGRRRRRRRGWRSGCKSLVFNVSSAIYVLIVFYSPRHVVQRVKAAVRALPLVHSSALVPVLVLALVPVLVPVPAVLLGEQGGVLVWTGRELKVASSSVQRAPVPGARVELEMPTWIRMMVDVAA